MMVLGKLEKEIYITFLITSCSLIVAHSILGHHINVNLSKILIFTSFLQKINSGYAVSVLSYPLLFHVGLPSTSPALQD